ncbi:hypothetical protein SARC_13537 [Sphaeroforma arctica JP610]|uniref:Uncharacterized protein n=1 Tax=Sphaeroforma arctica JP610 TaxID=667725 RepID=A0A0L0FAY2_9EUKA|nr:hypothetical protein SARC_13537 [Sphaeroforma arctica JP610]KNC73904.1 hypothetical protein SARC_13537 [Sphaeroforma arctica JP610]|eukprot:XP_014147806.1 hypothetical protein SARC_13537 [Sphaeroforma arctica JP610]
MADTFGMVHPELEAFEQPNLMSHITKTFKLVDERLVNSERLIEEQRILIEEQRIIEQDIDVQRIALENNRWRRAQRVQRVHARDIANLQNSVADMRVWMDANAGESHSSPSADRPIPSADGSVHSADRPTPSADRPTPSADRPTPSADRPTPGPNHSPLAARTVRINERRRHSLPK